MAELSFEVGEPVFLNVHLGSGNTGKFPQAIIKNASGSLLATVDLTDVGNGSYFDNSSYFMPNLPFIQVSYKIYDDAGHTTLSEDDQDASAIIAREDLVAALKRLDEVEVLVEDEGSVVVEAFGEQYIEVEHSEDQYVAIEADDSSTIVIAEDLEQAVVIVKEAC